MEHWAPSITELVEIEKAEAAEDLAEPSKHRNLAPSQSSVLEKRKSFKATADAMMRADVLRKMKEMITERKGALGCHLRRLETSGTLSAALLLEALREVLEPSLPWEDYLPELAHADAHGQYSVRKLLARYRVGHASDGWQANLLSDLRAKLINATSVEMLAFFDPNSDGTVTRVELLAASLTPPNLFFAVRTLCSYFYRLSLSPFSSHFLGAARALHRRE